jgi:hypothetical protein
MDPLVIEAVVAAATVAHLVAVEVAQNPSKRSRNESKSSRRGKRRVVASTAVHQAILRDYVGIPGNPTTPIFGSEFKFDVQAEQTPQSEAHGGHNGNSLVWRQSCCFHSLMVSRCHSPMQGIVAVNLTRQ